jgi:hypothetical protein
MPTTYWILESAEDRYLEALDPIPVLIRDVASSEGTTTPRSTC